MQPLAATLTPQYPDVSGQHPRYFVVFCNYLGRAVEKTLQATY